MMAIKSAIFLRLLFTSLVTVGFDFSDVVDRFQPTISAVISMLWRRPQCDAVTAVIEFPALYNCRSAIFPIHRQFSEISEILLYLFRFYLILHKMADNLRRAVQDINLGIDDAPVTLSAATVALAAAENRFILMGRPVMPRRQNLRSIVVAMPRVWGQAGLTHGRILPGHQFQFIFHSEESLETVMRRGPWAFNDRMLVLQRWTPLMNPPLLNYIPFWVQIRGIPYHFLSREVIAEIGRALGDFMEVEYDVWRQPQELICPYTYQLEH